MNSLGTIESIGVSGKAWMSTHALDIGSLFFEELRLAKKTIQISSFAAGHKSDVMEEFFQILEGQLENHHMKINVIINNDPKNKTVTPYSRKMLGMLQEKFPDRFFPQYFEQTKIKNLNKILHAKITVIDGTTALIGSSNLSKGALESNYEIMIKISGPAAAQLSEMISTLSRQIRAGTA